MNSNKKIAYGAITTSALDNSNYQQEMLKKYCKDKFNLRRIYITNTQIDRYYNLIKDILNKNMDILFITIFTRFCMNEKQIATIVRLCRINNITLIEI